MAMDTPYHHPNSQHPLDNIKSNDEETSGNQLEKVPTTARTIGRFTLRGKTDDLPQDWWFASTAIPLLAATIGPLANVLSIAALVTKWKVKLPNNGQLPEGTDDAGVNIPDPTWEITLNAVSLGLGFFGNFFLLLNFTRRIRYIVALPVTIISWYFATGILIGIIVAMNQYVPPIRPGETYSQGFWYAVIAATLYMIGSMVLMVNMLGYFLGHYPQHFDLDDDQRTLILQTMMFFFWLAGGAAVFSKVSGISYANALYFCDVTVLTVGFGDIFPPNDVGRGLVLPYAVFGIIFLGLMINSIRKFASGISRDKVIRKHALNERERTFGRTVTSEKELRDRLGLPPKREAGERRQPNGPKRQQTLEQFGHFETRGRSLVFREDRLPKPPLILSSSGRGGAGRAHQHRPAMSRDAKMQERTKGKGKKAKRAMRRERLLILREERDRFNAMRDIQAHTTRFKQYYALGMSFFAFGVLWCVGAAVFMKTEHRIQNLTYFQSLYFCYVSLLTIGYGDFAPRSNAGKPFFVIWSLMAVPTMTILVSDMGDTVVGAVNRGTFTLADWTVMPKRGVWHDFLVAWPRLRAWVLKRGKEKRAQERVEHGFDVQDPDDEETGVQAEVDAVDGGEDGGDGHEEDERRLNRLVTEEEINDHEMARQLARAIKRVAIDLRAERPKKYGYEEWVEFGRLMRFSSSKMRPGSGADEDDEDAEYEEGDGADELDDVALKWDWIGEDSPMLAMVSESEWVLDRLCESLNRYTRKQDKEARLTQQLKHHQFTLTTPTFPIKPKESSPDRHQITYPAHPGPRSPRTPPPDHHGQRSEHISPVLSRGPSGVEIVKLNSRENSRERVSGSRERGPREKLDVDYGEGENGSEDIRRGSGDEILIMAGTSARRRRKDGGKRVVAQEEEAEGWRLDED